MNTIGKRINYIRKEAKLRKNKFALEIGISPSYVSQIELGKKYPSDHIIKFICFRFNVNEDWLTEGTGEIHHKTPTLDDIPVLPLDKLKAIAALAPKDENIVNEESSIYSSTGLTLEEQVDILKENRNLKTQLQEIKNYISQNSRKDREERRRCVFDLKKIISIEEYKNEVFNADKNKKN